MKKKILFTVLALTVLLLAGLQTMSAQAAPPPVSPALRVQAVTGCPVVSNQVLMWDQINCQGNGYAANQPITWDVSPIAIRSVAIPSNWSVKLYESASYSSSSVCVPVTAPDLSVYQYSDGHTVVANAAWMQVLAQNNCGSPTPPAIPTLSSPANGASFPNNYDLTFVWNPAAGATNYVVEWWIDPNYPVQACNGTTATSCHIGNIATASTYYWHVKAYNGTGESDWSVTWSFTIQPAAVVCYTLTTSVSPFNSGYITPNLQPNCNNGTQYYAGTQVTLTANSYSGYAFSSWSGSASGTVNPTMLTMNGNKNVVANFVANPVCYTLTTSTNPIGGGTVNAYPTPNCGYQYLAGTQVTLTASPASGYTFNNWSGNASGSTNPTAIVIDSNKNIAANFSLLPTTGTVYGYVKDGGLPASGIHLRLVDDNLNVIATTTTDSYGYYHFDNMSALATMQKANAIQSRLPKAIRAPQAGQYYVAFFNDDNGRDSHHLWEWYGPGVTINPGRAVSGSNFDIIDVPLSQPNATTQALPVTFSWVRRNVVDDTDYELHLTNGTEPHPYYGQDLINNYTLTALPSGFAYNRAYYWYVVVKSSINGGAGTSFGENTVTFAAACSTKPALPLLIAPTNRATVNQRQILLDWSDANCATRYEVQVRLGSTTGTIVDSQTALTISQYTTKILTRNKNYYWHVRACNAKGCSAWTGWWWFKVSSTAP